MKGAKEFIQYLNEHRELGKELNKLSSADVIKKAEELGFSFTVDELDQAMEEARELTDDELDTISGGMDCSGHCGQTCESNCPENTYNQ